MVVSDLKISQQYTGRNTILGQGTTGMIVKAIKGLIQKTSLKKLMFHQGEYEWADDGGLIRNYGPTIL